MKILVLSQYYEPEPIPKPGELARDLHARGHAVTVVTGFPNYPSGQLYDGFRLAFRQRSRDGEIPVVRAFEYPYHGRNAFGRIFNYVSFMLAAPLATFGLGPFDVIYVWHPPLTVGVAAWVIGLIHRAPFVYDVQDIWPEAAVLSGILRPGWVVNALRVVERFVYRRADHVLVPTEEARANLIGKGVPPDRVTALPHWIDERLFDAAAASERDALRSSLGWSDRFVVLFTGNIGLVQGLETVIEAASHVNERDVILSFVGDGADRSRLQAMASKSGVGNRVQFIDRQPVDRMPAYMAAADALLVHLRASPLSRTVIPTKTMSYLAAGRPILMAMEGAAGELVHRAGAGIVVPSGDPGALASAVDSLARLPPAARQQLGSNGRAYLLTHLTKSSVLPRYNDLLARVGGQTGAAPCDAS